MTDPLGAPLRLAPTPDTPEQKRKEAERLHAATLTACDRTDTLGWTRTDTLELLRALGLVPDAVRAGGAARERFVVRP